MTDKSFSFSEVLGFGWRVMKANFWFFVVVSIVLFLISLPGQILNSVAEHYPEKIPPFLVLLLLPLTFIIEIIVGIGFIKITLAFCDGRQPKFGMLFDAQDCFWRYIGAGLLYGLIIASAFIVCALLFKLLPVTTGVSYSGLLVFIVAFIVAMILSIKFSLCFYFVIDKNLGPINALRASSQTTMGAKWLLFVFGILCGLINFLGALCFIIGLLATFPTVMVATALAYRQLSAQTPELVEFDIQGPDIQPAVGVPPGPGIQPATTIPPGLSIRISPNVQSSRDVQFGPGIRSGPNIQLDTEKKKNHILLLAVILGVAVIVGGIAYCFWPATKGAAVLSRQMEVTGILYSEDNPSAIIDGEIVKEGDTIGSVKVVKIHRDKVEFDSSGKRWTQQAQQVPVPAKQ